MFSSTAPTRRAPRPILHLSLLLPAEARDGQAGAPLPHHLDGPCELTLSAPDIVAAILEGSEPSGLSIAGLAGLSVEWEGQRRALG